MEGNFRNTLIIISAIVIGAIFIHGFWTIRKNKNPYKLKTKSDPVGPIERGFDGSGFDQDGVSKPRVIGANDVSDEEALKAQLPDAECYEDQAYKDFAEPSYESVTQVIDSLTSPPENIDFSEDEDEVLVPVGEKLTPVYKEPVTQEKKTQGKKNQPNKKSRNKTLTREKSAIKRDQMEINFGSLANTDSASATEEIPSITVNDDIEDTSASNIDTEVIVVSVVMLEGQMMSGAALLPSLLTLGMKFGDMDIFHRHEDNAGNGKVTFSLANMMNPGTFNLDEIESFATQGISMFMTLPNAGDPFEVFQQMIGAAKQLALEFQGQVLDDKRSVMTKQTEQHYIGKIREFERKSRIASL